LTLNEKTRKGIVFGILILALVWAYFNFSGPGKKKSKPPEKAYPTVALKEPPRTPDAADAVVDSLFEEYESRPWGKNPFYAGYRPETKMARPSKVELHLLGVLYREYNAQALINGHVVAVGDLVEGFRVTEIARDSVTLDNGGTTITLRVKKESS
jgi:type II secretory pathway component PulC